MSAPTPGRQGLPIILTVTRMPGGWRRRPWAVTVRYGFVEVSPPTLFRGRTIDDAIAAAVADIIRQGRTPLERIGAAHVEIRSDGAIHTGGAS